MRAFVMDIEVLPKKHKVNTRKWHEENPQDAKIAEIAEKFEVTETNNSIAKNVSDEDVEKILDAYSNNLKVDLYTIADIFHVSAEAVGKILRSPKYAERYQAAKMKRGDRYMQEGYATASQPYDMVMKGQELPYGMIAACKLKSNYNLAMAQVLNPELNPAGAKASGTVTIAIQSNVKLNI